MNYGKSESTGTTAKHAVCSPTSDWHRRV